MAECCRKSVAFCVLFGGIFFHLIGLPGTRLASSLWKWMEWYPLTFLKLRNVDLFLENVYYFTPQKVIIKGLSTRNSFHKKWTECAIQIRQTFIFDFNLVNHHGLWNYASLRSKFRNRNFSCRAIKKCKILVTERMPYCSSSTELWFGFCFWTLSDTRKHYSYSSAD